MRRVLLLCSSTDGHTRRICERVRSGLLAAGDSVALLAIEDARDLSPAGFDAAVIGARIRYGRTHRDVIAYANRFAAQLEAIPSAFFSVNVVARKPGKDRPQTNPYVRKFLHSVRWKPARLDVFAGRIDYPALGPLDRTIIRFIMWLTDGPTDPNAVVEFTDWQRVDAFTQALVA